MDDTTTIRGVAAYTSMRKLLELLVRKGLITRDEAFKVLEEAADAAQSSLSEIQNESPDS